MSIVYIKGRLNKNISRGLGGIRVKFMDIYMRDNGRIINKMDMVGVFGVMENIILGCIRMDLDMVRGKWLINMA